MSRFLCVNLPFYRLLGSHYNGNNLGLAYVAAVLNQNNHTAFIYNADFMDRKEYENLKGLFEKFQDYTEYFKNENHPIWEEVTQKIIDFKPDFVGYFCYTANVKAVDIVSKKVKQKLPHVKQLTGGPHSTLDKGLLAKLKYIDYQVIREGEYVTLDIVNGKDLKNLKGVAYRNSLGFIVHNGDAEVLDCDALPFPERDKFWGLTEEQKLTVDVSYVVSIRGCPYRCNYCASPYSWKRNKTQYRSPESLLSELRHLKKNYWNRVRDYDYSQSANTETKDKLLIKDNSSLYIVDDVFTVDKDRVKKILRMMIDEKLNMPFKAEMRTDHLDSETCSLLKEANCIRAKIGIETGSPKMLKLIQKDETREEIIEGCKMLKVAGVPFTAYLMTGFNGETDEDLRQTISLAKEVQADYYSLSILSPYYGTKMYYDLTEQGFPLDKQPFEYFFHQTGDMMVNNTISKEVLDEYLSLNELNKNKGYV